MEFNNDGLTHDFELFNSVTESKYVYVFE